MALSATPALWFLPFALPIALWVAWSDLATMKIPNKAVLALLGVYLVVGLIALPLPVYAWQLLHLPIILLIGFIMSIVGLIGAGDAKFAAVMAPFFALGDLTNAIAIFGFCVILGFATHRLARLSPLRKITPNWESWERTRDFPMGYPLAGMLIVYLCLAAFWT